MTCLLFAAYGCGSGETLTDPYDVYEMADSLGIAASASDASKNYFSTGLCVSEDIALGTDTTTSSVAEGAGAFNLSTGQVVYAKNLYERLYPASTTKILTDTTTSSVAEGAGAFNLSTGQVVYAKNLYERLYPASTTKILTAYLALKYCDDLDAYVTVSENAAKQAADSSVCDLRAGDRVKLRDLLYGMMLRSGNDAAIAIAEHVSGSVEAFAELMNREAAAMGATQTHFVNPNGLPDANHYTTVYDMYLIFAKALENQMFSEIIAAKS